MTDRIRGVLVDLGDTLIHLDTSWEEVFQAELHGIYRYLTDSGVKVDFQKFSSVLVRAFDDASSKANLYKIEIPMEEIIGKVVGKFGVRNPYQGFVQGALEEFYEPEIRSWQLFPDAVEALVSLQENGYLLGLVSNAKSDWCVRAILRKFELDTFFKIILTSAALRIRKPRPDIFLKALDALSVRPTETVFIGDSLDADIIGARNVGIHTIYVRRKPAEHDLLIDPDATVTSLSEAVRIVNGWANVG